MLALLLASVVGISLGLLGAGGSILAVPILKYAAGLPTKEAVATSLATVGMVALVGAIQAWREDRVRVKQALAFAALSSLGTLVGVRVAAHLSDHVQMGIFILVMLYALVAMHRKAKAVAKSGLPPLPHSNYGKLLGQTIAVGILTGIVGVGGGFLVVPALVSIYDLPIKTATGTSLCVIFINSAIAVGAYSQVVSINWSFTAEFVVSALLGLLLGMALSRKLDTGRIEQIFFVAVALVGAFTIVQELKLI